MTGTSQPSSAVAPARTASTFHAADELIARIDATGAATCVGLDPVIDRLPASLRPSDESDALQCARAIESFSHEVIEAIRHDAAAVKVQAACFERFGAEGYAAMLRVVHRARESGLVVVLDFKRGDIGISAEHYAASARSAGAHWTTISAYLGADGIAPFLAQGHGSFALVRTSNPSGDALQALRLATGETVSERVAMLVDEIGRATRGASGFSNLGAVVGATKRAEIAALRARMPHTMFLVPGYGAQGGTADDVRACFTAPNRGALITASRSVIYPSASTSTAASSWQGAIRDAARVFADEIRTISRGTCG